METRPEAPPPAAPVKSRKSAKPAPVAVKLPAILFEGDFPPPAPAAPTGPGQRFELGPVSPPAPPTPPLPARAAEVPELPESYGTGRLLMTPRDPFWLYAHWDFSFEHLRRFNSRSVDGHLVLRVYPNAVSGSPVTENHLHPESREWFVNVPAADTAYVADLGYYSAPGRWKSVVQSPVVRTPAATMSAEVTVQFATVPVEAAVRQVIEAVQESGAPTPASAPPPPPVPQPAAPVETTRAELPPAGIELTPVESSAPAAPLPPAPVESSRVALAPAPPALTPVEASASIAPSPVGQRGEPPAPMPAAIPTAPETAPTAPSPAPAPQTQTAWTPAQERAFGAILKLVGEAGRAGGSSQELAALIRQQLGAEASSAPAPGSQSGTPLPHGTPSSASLVAPATPDAAPAKRGFWFNVNAELVIYGATDPDAEVTIGGRVIKLRKDGTFGYRFALPDGHFALPVVAVAADRSDGRAADLRFSRQTEYRGDVAAHPQDTALKPPTVENVP